MINNLIGRRGFLAGAGAMITTNAVAKLKPAIAGTPITYVGTNLSGPDLNPQTLPGTVNVDYIWPRAEDLSYWLGKGCNIIRQPFLWERMQHTQFGPLDTAQLSYLDAVVNTVTGAGAVLVADVHNEGYGYGNLVGSTGTPTTALCDLWTKLAVHYAGNQKVVFDIMNEPAAAIGVANWTAIVNQVLIAIRNTGARNTCLIEGLSDDAASFIINGDAQGMLGVFDPISNSCVEVHQYLNADGNGDTGDIVATTIGRQRVAAVTAWARSHGLKLYLGETGGPPNAAGAAAIADLLAYLQTNSDVWFAATMWGAFAYPPTYPLLSQPLRLNVFNPTTGAIVDQPQASALFSYAPGGSKRAG